MTMANSALDRRNVCIVEKTTVEHEAIAPEDELLGIAATSSSTGSSNNTKHQQTRTNSYDNDKENSICAGAAEDEDRVPPPPDPYGCVGGATTNQSHCEIWNCGAMANSPTKSRYVIETTELKTARLNKRRIQKKLPQQQSGKTKSDYGTITESDISDEPGEHSSTESNFSSSPVKNGNRIRRSHKFLTTGAKTRYPSNSRAKRHQKALKKNAKLPIIEAPLSPRIKPNSKETELAHVMVELEELKVLAATESNRPNLSSPLSSPRSRRSNRSSPRNSASLKEGPPLPLTIEVPHLVLQTLPQQKRKKKKFKARSSDNVSITSAPSTKGQSKGPKSYRAKLAKVKAKKKSNERRVRFCYPEITDTNYRPKTLEEDVDSLYFQEEELLVWENDEETTLRDRFEVVVTEIGETDDSETDTIKIGPPIISFHNSCSYSYQDDEDEYS